MLCITACRCKQTDRPQGLTAMMGRPQHWGAQLLASGAGMRLSMVINI